MLDECKGDKLEDLLASFSIIVLRKVMASSKRRPTDLAFKLATAKILTADEQELMLPLVVAHRGSLRTSLDHKKSYRERCHALQRTIDTKSFKNAGRTKSLKQHHGGPANLGEEAALKDIQDLIRRNWHGNNQWAKVILEGDSTSSTDRIWDRPFHDLWHDAHQGLSVAKEEESKSLVQDLENRVSTQQARVRKWAAYRQSLQRDSRQDSENRSQPPTKQASVKFSRHETLKLGVKEPVLTGPEPSSTAPDYSRLIASMKEELSSVGKPVKRSSNSSALPRLAPKVRRPMARSDSPESSKVLAVRGPSLPVEANNHNYEPRNSFTGTPNGHQESSSTSNTASNSASEASSDAESSAEDGEDTVIICKEASPKQNDENLSQGRTVIESENSRRGFSIAVSIDHPDENTAQPPPSPVRRMTLAERTRQSMGLQDLLAQQIISSVTSPQEDSPIKPPQQPRQSNMNTLLERTRQSMSLLPKLPPKPRRSSYMRESISYPVNQFETPSRASLAPIADHDESGEARDTTPRDELFSQEADYASVFKSRPKIACSPVMSPVAGEGDLEEVEERIRGLEVDDVDEDMDLNSSPLMRVRKSYR